MRRILIYMVAGLFAINVSAGPAATPTASSAIQEYLRQSHLTQRERSFRDLVRELGPNLPKDQLAVVNDIAARIPNAVVPKIVARQIKNNRGGQDLQLNINASGQSVTMLISQEGDHTEITVTGAVNKKSKTIKFSPSDAPAKIVALERELANEAHIPVKSKRLHLELLPAEAVAKLDAKAKRSYFRRLQGLIAAIERVQAARENRKATATSSIWDLLLKRAFASGAGAAGQPCMIAGWATKYGGDGVCGSDDFGNGIHTEAGNTQVACNPNIYGVGSDGKEIFVNTKAGPGVCTDKIPDKWAPFPSTIKSKDEFDKQMGATMGALSDAISACQDMKKANKGDTKPCDDLSKRYAALKGKECDILKQQPKFAQIDCSVPANVDTQPPPPPAPPASPLDEPNPPADACQAGVDGAAKDSLHDCDPSMIAPVDGCQDLYYCNCPDNSGVADDGNGNYATSCKPSPAPICDVPKDPPPDHHDGGFNIWPLFICLGVGVLAGYAACRFNVFGMCPPTVITTNTNTTTTITVPGPSPTPIILPITSPTGPGTH